MPTPPKAELKDYMWCVGCAAYVPKKLLKQEAGFMFTDGQLACPAGHTELQDVTEKTDDPPKPS
jgi:hypothetical protein